MTYLKIIFGFLAWGVLFFYAGSNWLESKRENACLDEVQKVQPSIKLVERRCLETAEVYMQNKEYGSAAWFYLLGGDLDKNINEVEAKITDDFYMNIGHTYVLKGEFEKARKIYRDYPWEGGGSYLYADEGMQGDYEILPRLYLEDREKLEKGLSLWNEIYAPLDKVVKAHNAYEMAKESDKTQETISYLKEYLEYAVLYKNQSAIEYIEKKKELADLYYYDSQERASIEVYKEIADEYRNIDTKQYEYVDILLSIATSYAYIDEYNMSIEYYNEIISVIKESNSTELPSLDSIYENIGDSYSSMNTNNNINLYDKALLYYSKALSYKEEHRPLAYNELSRTYDSIGSIYYKQKQYKKSIESLNKSIEYKKQELRSLDDYDMDDALEALALLYKNLVKNYTGLDEKGNVLETAKNLIKYLEKEHETQYQYLAEAYYNLGEKEENATEVFSLQVRAVEYMKEHVETAWSSRTEEEYAENLIYYFEVLKNDARSLSDNNRSQFLKHIDAFRIFQERHFALAEPNEYILAKSYFMVSRAYDDMNVSNNSRNYLDKALVSIKKVIEHEEDELEKDRYARLLDNYSVYLWNQRYEAREHQDIKDIPDEVKALISEYKKFKEENYDEESTVLKETYKTIDNFYLSKNIYQVD